jgi:uncharacterized membrane protein (DUF4010 family)
MTEEKFFVARQKTPGTASGIRNDIVMNFFEQATQNHLEAFATSLAIGLLVGLERQRNPDAKAGLRTCGLVALLGTLAALLGSETGSAWIVAVGLAAVAAMMIAANAAEPSEHGDPGTTSVVALMLCYGLGAAVWYGYVLSAVILGIATTLLLYFKTELHGLSRSLTAKDLTSILQFAVLSFVILPILPNRDFGPYSAFNPHQIWWMVVLISGVSLAGYAALRLVGQRYGAAVIGLLGGLVSSTATTLVFARNARGQEPLVKTATLVILIASLVVMLRLWLLGALLAPTLMLPLALVLGAGLLLGMLITAWGWRSLAGEGELPMPDVSNPTEIRTALTFGLLYAAVLFFSAWLQDIGGSNGLYVVALISGLTDVDAITLSTLRLYNVDKLTPMQAVISISLATISNLVFKSGLVLFVGGVALGKRAIPGFVAVAAGIGGALALLA